MTTPEALNELADRCEAEFDVMSSPLDADIAIAVGWTFDAAMPFWWRAPDSIKWVMAPPAYTTSLDAAVTLVPERFCYLLEHRRTDGFVMAFVSQDLNRLPVGQEALCGDCRRYGGGPAAALTAAALRARAADMQARARATSNPSTRSP